MKYCVKCGYMLEDTDIICPKCSEVQPDFTNGAGQNGSQNQSAPNQEAAGQEANAESAGGYHPQGSSPYYPPRPKESFGSSEMTPYLIWGIVLIFFCMPFGLVSTILSAISFNVKNRQELENNKKLARIFCIIGTIGAVFVVLFFLMIALAVPFFTSAIHGSVSNYSTFN